MWFQHDVFPGKSIGPTAWKLTHPGLYQKVRTHVEERNERRSSGKDAFGLGVHPHALPLIQAAASLLNQGLVLLVVPVGVQQRPRSP